MDTGMKELVRLAAQVLETGQPTTVSAETMSNIREEYRIRAMTQLQTMHSHQRAGERQWNQMRFY